MKTKSCIGAALLILVAVGCQKNEVESPDSKFPMDYYIGLKGGAINQVINHEFLDKMNENLEMNGLNYRVAIAELITAAGSNEMGRTVYSKYVGNKQLDADFVPNDQRREWTLDGTKITYAIDQTLTDAEPTGDLINAEQANTAIERAFSSWESLKSSEIGLTKKNDIGEDIGIVAFLEELGGSPFVFADIQIAGWGDIDFDEGILGVTFTFIFIDDEGNPTDIDNNMKVDAAFREIYFDPSWEWADNGIDGIDVESIAVHEIGHGLSQGHFGTVFVDQKGYLHVTPRAVMNAFYFGQFRILQKTDIAGHSSIWSDWPMK